MSKTTPYIDLGKEANDLVTKGFPAKGEIKVLRDVSAKGVLIKSSLVRNKDGGVNLTFEPEYKQTIGAFPFTFKGKGESQTSLTEARVIINDVGAPGTEINPWVKRVQGKDGFDITGGAKIGFANELVNFSAEATTPSDFSSVKGEGSLVVQYPKGLFWGAKLAYPADGSTEEKKEYNLGVRVHCAVNSDNNFTAALETPTPKPGQVGEQQLSLTWSQTISSSFKAVTSFVYPKTSAPSATFAAESKWDSTTVAKTKLIVSKDSRLGVSYSQAVGPSAVVTLGADLNANTLIGAPGGASNAFGLELKIK